MNSLLKYLFSIPILILCLLPSQASANPRVCFYKTDGGQRQCVTLNVAGRVYHLPQGFSNVRLRQMDLFGLPPSSIFYLCRNNHGQGSCREFYENGTGKPLFNEKFKSMYWLDEAAKLAQRETCKQNAWEVCYYRHRFFQGRHWCITKRAGQMEVKQNFFGHNDEASSMLGYAWDGRRYFFGYQRPQVTSYADYYYQGDSFTLVLPFRVGELGSNVNDWISSAKLTCNR